MALRWRDIDFAGQAIRVRGNLSYGQIVTPKSGKVRVVPMVDEVAPHLARLAHRPVQTGDEDPVFASPLGGHLDASALRRRFVDATQRAGLRTLPFHSLRHFFGSMAAPRSRAGGDARGAGAASGRRSRSGRRSWRERRSV
jgi:integrase